MAIKLEASLVAALRADEMSGEDWELEYEQADPREALRAQLVNVEARRQTLLEALESGHLRAEVYAAREEQLGHRERDLRAQIAAAQAPKRVPRPVFGGLADLLESDVPLARKRAALAAYFLGATWQGGALRLQARAI